MKRRTHEAAAVLGVHPLNLVPYLLELGVSFEAAWPEIEEDWVEAVRGLDWKRFRHPEGEVEGPAGHSEAPPAGMPSVSESAAQVVEKLWRQRHWGHNTVSWDTLHNHLCQHVRGLEEAVRGLILRGYLVAERPRGPYSLNSAKKGEIERIARARVSG